MPGLTNLDKEKLLADLSQPIGDAWLACDGYLVAAMIKQDKRKLVILVSVNGKIPLPKHYQTLDNLSDVEQKFMAKQTKSRVAPSKLRKLERQFGKKHCREQGLYAKYYLVLPIFNSPRAFIRQLCQQCENISLLRYGDYKARLEAL